MSFVKSQILDQLANSYPNFLRRDLEKALNLVLNEIIKTVAKGNSVQIRGFGSFFTKAREKRIGMNPQNGKNIEIEKKTHPKFKMGKILFKKLNPK